MGASRVGAMIAARQFSTMKRTLSRPAPHVLAAIEEGKRKSRIARAQVRAMLAVPGADARQFYEAETDKDRRVALLGYLRRGMEALN